MKRLNLVQFYTVPGTLLMKKEVNLIKNVFEDLNYEWHMPYMTTEGAINRKEVGMHRGLYYIYPEVNFYFGKAESKEGRGTVYYRHKTHRPKLDVDLRALYGPEKIKCEPNWKFPKGFREGVAKYLLKGDVSIPDHFKIDKKSGRCKNGNYRCRPSNLDFKDKHKIEHIVEIDTLPVLVWNLNHLSEKAIKEIESAVITTIWPYCNDETYRKRKKEEV